MELSKTQYHPNVEVRESEKEGRGLFATAPISRGEVLTITAGRKIITEEILTLRFPYHAFQVEQEVLLAPWDESRLEGMFLANHSCNPNAGVRGETTLVALRDILTGEEICYDYAMTDSEPISGTAFEMECRCGTQGCRGIVSDRDWRKPALQEKYGGYFSSYLTKRLGNRPSPLF